MIGAHLQSLNYAPRNTSDPRVAAMNISQKREGPDGKLYAVGNQDDYGKYRTLTDEELEEEERMNLEMASALNMMGGKLDSRGNSRKKNPSSFVPPHLGTGSRAKKIEKRAWDKKIEREEHRQSSDVGDQAELEHSKGMETLSSEDRLMQAVATMQDKYTENVSVIEQLFSEKKQMEKRMAALEDELNRTKREQRRAESMRKQVQSKDRLNQTAPGLAQGRGFTDDDVESPHRGRGSGSGGRDRDSRLARTMDAGGREGSRWADESEDIDLLIGGDIGEEPDDDDDDDLPAPAYVDSPPRARRGGDREGEATVRVSAADMASMFAEEPLRGSAAADRGRALGSSQRSRGASSDRQRGPRDSGGSVRRSQSLTRRPSAGLSSSLQADTDRYLQKRNLIKQKEDRERAEQEQYELQLKEKFMRASHTGREFSSMNIRAQEAEARRKERMKRKHEKARQEEEEKLERERLERTRTAKYKKPLGTDKSWQQRQQEEEMKRKDRIEQRKMDLTSKSAYPSTMRDSVDKWTVKKNAPEEEPALTTTSKSFVAQSPEEVAARLKRKQENWERKLEREKEKNKATHSNAAPSRQAQEMEARHRAIAAKNKERMERNSKKEQEAKEAEELKRRKSMEKLMNAKVPESSRQLTKAAEYRAKTVQAAQAKALEEEQREAAIQKKKERKLKETSAFLKSLVKRRALTPQEKEEELQQRVKSSAEQFKMNRLKNKQKIKEAQLNRASLIERHDQSVAKANAGTAALGKLANAFVTGKTSTGAESKADAWKDLAREEDFLDETDKIKLGLRDNLRDDLDDFA